VESFKHLGHVINSEFDDADDIKNKQPFSLDKLIMFSVISVNSPPMSCKCFLTITV
jgi:hypothetical protein